MQISLLHLLSLLLLIMIVRIKEPQDRQLVTTVIHLI